eukprot:EG_transcript_20785
MTSSVDLLRGTTQDSTDSMAQTIQELLILRANDQFNARLTEGNQKMAELIAAVQASGFQNYDLRPSRFDFHSRFLSTFYRPGFTTMRGHPYFTSAAMFGGVFQNPSDEYATRMYWVTWVYLNLDIMTQQYNHTLYVSTLALAPDEQWTTQNVSYVDQQTGTSVYTLSSTTLPAADYPMKNDPSGWGTALYFNPWDGQVELSAWQWLPAQNNTWLQPYISISASTISDELAQELSGAPDDRLVLFFRQPHGYMIAASHGKYWSDSDVDRRHIFPVTNPPNISAYRLWNCTSSTDALIQQACQQLFATYRSWTAIPPLRQ